MEVYILIDNKPQGPYTRELVQRYLKSGQLKATDVAAYAGSSDWQPLSVMMRSWGGSRRATARNPNSIIGIVTVLVLALVVGWVVVRLLRHLPDSVVKDSPKAEPNTVAQIEDDGYPKTLAELNKWYVEPPEGQNAATYFFKGGAAIQITNVDYYSQSLPLFGRGVLLTAGPLLPEVRQSIVAFVQKNEPAWKILQEGAPYEQARYPIDLTQGPATLLRHPAKIKIAVQLGALRTALYAANRQPKQSVDAYLLSLAIAQSLKDEPLLISQLTRDACLAVQKDSLQFVFSSAAIPPADLDRLAAAVDKVETQDSEGVPFTRAWVGDRVIALSLLDLPPEQLEKQIESAFVGSTNLVPSQMITNLTAQRPFMRATFARVLAMRQEPFPERLKVKDYLQAQAVEATNRQFYLFQLFLSDSGNSVHHEATAVANLRLMKTAIALEQFRRANRKYPDALAELVPKFLPELPADPFNGEPMFYLKSTGYELLCRGATGAPINFRVETPPKL